MLSFPYLLAHARTLQATASKYLSPEYINKDDCLLIRHKNETAPPVRITLKKLPEELTQLALLTHRQHEVVQKLRGDPKALTLEEWVWEYVLSDYVEQRLSNWSYKKGIVRYQLDGEIKEISVEKEQAEDLHKSLVAVNTIKRGYTLLEIRGRHYEVYPPTGIPLATSATSCTCQEFERERRCHHLYTVQAILNLKLRS